MGTGMRLTKSSLCHKRGKIMFGTLLLALAASSIATIIIAAGTVSVTLLTSPGGHSMRALGGKPFNVSCEELGGTAGKFSFLKWTKNGGQEISEGDPSAVKIGNKLFLTFINPKTDDGGLYSCSAIYDNGIQLQEKIFLEFYATKPEFPISFENMTLVAGGFHYLMCQAYGDPPINYKWYNQDEVEITEDIGKPIYVSNYKSHSRLVFQRLSREHEGSYTCTANNTHGLASKVYSVRVSPPSERNDTDNGTSRFRDAKVLEYTTRSVTFYITTSGPIEYIEAKYREGKRQTNTTIIRLNPAPGNKSYEIGNLLPSGLYSFQFKTVPSDSDDWSREYNVTLLPDAPEILWQSIGDRSVRLQWFTKTDDFMRGTIDKYQIKYFSVQMVRGNSWTSRNCSVTIEVPTCFGSSYTISGLSAQIFYQIDVRAHTEGGYGEPTSQKIYMKTV